MNDHMVLYLDQYGNQLVLIVTGLNVTIVLKTDLATFHNDARTQTLANKLRLQMKTQSNSS